MRLDIVEFRELMFFIFFIYLFFETKIYLALWVAFFDFVSAFKSASLINAATFKLVITVYVCILLASYVYKFRGIVFGKQVVENVKLKAFSSDKNKKRRIGIASLLLFVANMVAIIVVP